MKKVPPKWFRRLVLAPAVLGGVVLLLLSMPVWLIGAAFASRFVPGRWRPLRLLWFGFIYLFNEALVLVLLFGTWIASGFGWKIRTRRFQDLHYALMAWFLRRVVGSARYTFGLTFRREDDLQPRPAEERRPVLVLSRHAGPGDSLLLIDSALNRMHRHPRIVLKDLLQYDPAVDIVLNRLPNRFVPSTGRAGEAAVEAIRDLASTMAPVDALVIFPEGGNFTPTRRTRIIERFQERGREDLAERARNLTHLLPPKPTGALTAIAAAPTADVVFVGHAGLEAMSTLRDIWHGLKMDQEIVTHLWRVAAEDIPATEAERDRWLYAQWAMIDRWLGEKAAESVVSDDTQAK
jgi:1-acyl-sn-glycerol-3-phosphate acyltransferase